MAVGPDDTHDIGLLTTVAEELVDRVPQVIRLAVGNIIGQPAKLLLELGPAFH